MGARNAGEERAREDEVDGAAGKMIRITNGRGLGAGAVAGAKGNGRAGGSAPKHRHAGLGPREGAPRIGMTGGAWTRGRREWARETQGRNEI